MAVRGLVATDLEAASAVCMAAFMHSVAGSLSAAGVRTFTRIASAQGFADRMADDNEMLVFEAAGTIKGVAELKLGRHISMLFVAPTCQREGIGRALIAALIERAQAPVLSVSASLTSVAAYERYGFHVSGPVAETAGFIYQPMELALPPHAAQGSER